MKSNYICSRKKRLVGNSKFLMLLIFAWSSFSATQVFSQSLTEKVYVRDKSSVRLKELDTGFKQFHGEISFGLVNSLNETDLVLVDDALHYRPYYQDSIRFMTTACGYYYSTEHLSESDIDIEYMIDLLTESGRAEYEGKESFLEATYQALSAPAKERLDELIMSNSRTISDRVSISFDYEKFAQESSNDAILERISRICERLPLVVESFPESGYIEIEETIIDVRD